LNMSKKDCAPAGVADASASAKPAAGAAPSSNFLTGVPKQ
jgi:hypothetical protein